MLTIAGYTIDRVVRISQEHNRLTLEMLSGQTLPVADEVQDVILRFAQLSLGFETPIALRIVGRPGNERIVAAAEYTLRWVDALEPTETHLKVWLSGRPGAYRFSKPEANEQESLLLHSKQSKEQLLFFLAGEIQAVAQLSKEQTNLLLAS
jgi:hypothetical protein